MHSGTLEERRIARHNKQSMIAIGVLMLSLAALQSPLWRKAADLSVYVRSGGAALIASEGPIARVALDGQQATAEVVGAREVLVRGKSLGEAHLRIISTDGRTSSYRVIVQADTAKSALGAMASSKP